MARLIASLFMLASLVLSVAARAGEPPSQRLYVPEDKKHLHSPGPPLTNTTERPWVDIQTAIQKGDLAALARLLPADVVAGQRPWS